MDYVTREGRDEAGRIADLLGRALADISRACADAEALAESPESLSPAAWQWERLRGRLAIRPYLGGFRSIQQALADVAKNENNEQEA